jgi:lipopolysaccharide export system protein LptC
VAARPDVEDATVITVDGTRIALRSTAGDTVEIVAGSSRIDSQAKILTTAALTRISASSGYTMETEGLIANFEAGTVETTGPLEVRAPFGRLSTGHMLVRGANDDGGLMIVFNQGVRLVYMPKEQE